MVELHRSLSVRGRCRDDRIGCALEIGMSVLADAAHAGFGAKRNHLRIGAQAIRGWCAELLREGLNTTALWRVVAQAGLARGDQTIELARATHRDDLSRQSVTERDRAGLVQQQDI